VRFHPRRPSAALIVSIVALVVALGGTAFAGPVAQIAKKISGSSIKTHSISGNRLKNNTLTGTQINESKLGTVPSALAAATASTAGTANKANSATTATTAGTALNANALGGVGPAGFVSSSKIARWDIPMNKGAADKTFTFGPLTFTAHCAAGAASGETVGTLTVQTSVSHLVADGPFTDSDFTTGETHTWITEDSTNADDWNSVEPRLFDPAGSFSVFDGDGESTGVWVNTPGADCRFVGYLVNDAG
jgi:hypothetical protein